MPAISFIIPAHNEERHLPRTLAAVREVIAALQADQQAGLPPGGPPLDAEIIVADDASTDRTAAIAREAGAIVVRHERRQISATRNLGYRASRGALCFFVDADTLVNPPLVRAAITLMREGAVGGGCLMRFDGRVPVHARVMAWGILGWMWLANLCGAAFFFARRDALDRVAAAQGRSADTGEGAHAGGGGPWDESVFAGEEILLARALKAIGPFRLTPSHLRATTSGRKLRTYSLAEMLGFFWRAGLGGRRFLRDRRNLGLWYDERREDPG